MSVRSVTPRLRSRPGGNLVILALLVCSSVYPRLDAKILNVREWGFAQHGLRRRAKVRSLVTTARAASLSESRQPTGPAPPLERRQARRVRKVVRNREAACDGVAQPTRYGPSAPPAPGFFGAPATMLDRGRQRGTGGDEA